MDGQEHVCWGIVGCGWVARDYVAPGMRAAHGAKLVALCDLNQQAMARIAAATPGAQQFTDLDMFLALPELDAVYVATPNHLHAPLTIAAAQAGKHVLCEKPMATGIADAERMVAACNAMNVRYATAFDQRFHARHGQLRGLIEAGSLGMITRVAIHYACWTPTDWRPETDEGAHENWRIDPAQAGGGAFIDLAPHGLDLAQYLLGETLDVVSAMFQRRVFTYPVDDGAMLIGRFASGALFSQHVAYNCPDTFPRRTLEVYGTHAAAILRNTMGQTPGGTLTLIHTDGREEQPFIDPRDDVSPFQRQVEAFSQHLLNSTPFPFPPARDLHTMSLIEQAGQ